MRVLGVIAVLGGLAAFSHAQWSDNFDSYATGSQMHGQGGWKGWDNLAGAGALTSSLYSVSGPNSVNTVGASDLVHTYAGYTSGQWQYNASVYIPTGYTGSAYFILLNTYNDSGPYNWSVQLHYDATDGFVRDDNSVGGTMTPVAFSTGQWSTISVLIDLTANTRVVKFNGSNVSTGTWTQSGGALNIGAVDLFANTGNVYYDNVSLSAVPEPGTIAALGLGVAALLRRRRR